MARPRSFQRLQHELPEGAELYLFDPGGRIHVIGSATYRQLDPTRRAGDQQHFLRFIDDEQFTRYLIGSAQTSDQNPTNATTKLGIVQPHSAFTPHAHGAEHFVLSLGYASCGLYDQQRERVVHVRLPPGAMLHIPEMMPHSFNNRAGEPLLLLVANTGMGIDHEDYAITAAQAEQRAHQHALVGHAHHAHYPAPREPDEATDAVDYARLAAALRRLEQEMPHSATHTMMNLHERIAARLRKWVWLLEAR